MNNFLKNNEQSLSAIAIISFLLLIVVMLRNLPNLSERNQLAQIIAIETDLLKTWQQSKGLKSTLAYNSEGGGVVLLQRMLSQDIDIYPQKKVTGYYGNLTKAAVIRFQKEYNLSQTGTVDEATKDKLNEIFLSFLCLEQTTLYPEFLLKKVSKRFPLPKSYAPPSLEDISTKVKTIRTTCIRSDIAPHLIEMFNGAQQDGVYLAITSGYRKPEIQKYLYDFWLRVQGVSAIDEIAEPGGSEHQLGTTVDLTDASIGYAGVDDRFAYSDGGRWLMSNAYKYGFTMSYPKGKQRVTGYKYEPWHWRYVGVEIATYLYNQGLAFNETSLNAQKPPPRNEIKNGLDLSASAVISVFINADGFENFLIEKNRDRILPIASITKLMVALVASDVYEYDDTIMMSESSLRGKGMSGYYATGDSFLFQDALRALLLASHNEIANAMAERVGIENFVKRMNRKANELGLRNTYFFNVTGLDPKIGSEKINQSTVFDIYKLLRYIFENRADIFSVLEKNEYDLIDTDGVFKVKIQSTNKLITNQNTALQVLGGKTGETPRAKMNLAVVSDAPSNGRIISVVIGSSDHFGDMQKILKYIKDSFVW